MVQFMNAFDSAMNLLDDKFSLLTSSKQIVSSTNEEDKVLLLLDLIINIFWRTMLANNLINFSSQLKCGISPWPLLIRST